MTRFVVSSRAQTDLETIDEYLSGRSLDAADRVINELYASFTLLGAQPGLGRRRPEWTARQLRFWNIPAFPNYVVMYEDEVTPIRIARVLHSAMDVPTHL